MKIACVECLSVNQVPEQRLNDTPVCGKCKSRLLPGHPVELDDGNFQSFVAKTELPVVVDFWAAWCGPCQMMAPAFAEAAVALSATAILAKVNTEVAKQTAARYRISSIPTLICFRNGQEVGRKSGLLNAQQLVQWVKSLGTG